MFEKLVKYVISVVKYIQIFQKIQELVVRKNRKHLNSASEESLHSVYGSEF